MNLKLVRGRAELYGIFGQLLDENGNVIAVTLEHAYSDGDAFVPKVAVGTYTCTRHAPNRLPYETFEIQNVPNFQGQTVTGILIHVGNYNKDSVGCVLVGEYFGVGCILESKVAFEKLMALQEGVESFTLVVT